MEDIFIINKNNKEYVHIDTIRYKNQMLYHFGSLEDEIFCTKEGLEYVPIQDDFQIALIKNKLGLINSTKIYSLNGFLSETKKEIQFYLKMCEKMVLYGKLTADVVDNEEKEEILNEEKENLKKAKEKFNLDIDLEKISKKIEKIKIIKKDKLYHCSGYYNSLHNVIALERRNVINNNNKWDKRVRFHEFVHGITGLKTLFYNIGPFRGFLEGETDNITEDFLDDNTSCIESHKKMVKKIRYN